MNYISDFYDNLGNQYTAILIAFLTGFTVGVLKFGGSSTVIGILIGLIFAVAAGFIIGFIHTSMPETATVTFKVKPLFTICLLILFFFIVTSSPSINKFFAEIEKKM